MSMTEWACQWKTFLDGDFDRMMTHHPLGRTPLTEAEAREEVNGLNGAHVPARLVRREVSDWEPTA